MIIPIEGYEVICDNCDKSVVFYESREEYSGLEIDRHFINFLKDLMSEGWYIEDPESGEGEILCPECSAHR